MPPDAKSWLIWKDPNVGKDWGQEEKGTTEDEMIGWHHRLDGHGFGWTPEVGDRQGGLACCSSWGRKESDMTEQLNWTEVTMQDKGACFRNSIKVNRHILSHFSQVQLFATLWMVARQTPLSTGFSRREYRSGLPCPSPGYLPNPGIELISLMSPEMAGGFFTTSTTWKEYYIYCMN